jgi:hypothetical protein
LAVLRDGVLEQCDSSCKTKSESLNDFSENHVCEHIQQARQRVRRDKDNPVIVLHKSGLDPSIENDLKEFAHPPVVQQLHNENGERLGLV